MNSIGHFWAIGKEQPQNDLHEGLGEALSADEYKALYGWDFRETFGDNLLLPLMNHLGKYAVRVHNVQVFVDRILDKLVAGGLYGLMGPMNYHSPSEKGRYFDLFGWMLFLSLGAKEGKL